MIGNRKIIHTYVTSTDLAVGTSKIIPRGEYGLLQKELTGMDTLFIAL